MKYKVGDKVKTLIESVSLPKGTIGVIERMDNSQIPYRVYSKDLDDFDWFGESQLEPISESFKTPIPYAVPDWFTWGYEHKCIVWDDKGEEKRERTIYCYSGYDFFGTDGTCWRHAEPIPETKPLADALLEGLDFGCQQDNVKKLVENILNLKGDKDGK